MVERSEEAEELLVTLDATPPTAVSACDGWTAHEVAAHVAGIAVEVVRHLDPYRQGEPVPPTRSFEEREAPLQALGHGELLRRLDVEEERMRQLVDEVLGSEPDAVIPWTGRRMAVAKFVPHLRNEHALHRWDIAGDDEVSDRLVGRQALVEHSVGELGAILLRAGRRHDPEPDEDLSVALRSPGQPDLVVTVEGERAAVAWAEQGGDGLPALDLDPGARHLLLWGRRPDRRGRITSQLSTRLLGRLQALLSGY